MRTNVELREYANEFQMNHNGCLPMVVVVKDGIMVRNATETSDQRPWGSETYANFSWIEYWRAFANSDGSGRTPEPAQMPKYCSSHHTYDLVKLMSQGPLVGAHVEVVNNQGKPLSDRVFIVPLCCECNSKHGEIINVQSGTRLVEVVDPVR